MSDIWSFLYNPSAASQQNNQGGSSVNAMPDWYVDYTKNLLAGAQAATSEPYQPYDQQRIAELTPDQLASQETVRSNVGSQTATMDAAKNLVATGGNANTAGAAAPAYGAAMGALNPSLTANTAGTAAPAFADASTALSGAQMQGATGVLGQVAGQSLPGQISEYMNPYTTAVTDRIAELGGRNLQENLLPQVNSTFTGAGQFGSTRNADFTARALRDTQDSVLGAQASALESGYQNAGQNYLADQSLRTNAATAQGNLLGANAGRLTTLGDTQSTVAARDLATQQQGAGVLGQLATQQAGVAGADAGRSIQAGTATGALGQAAQQINTNDAGMLEHIGAMDQTQAQSSLDLAYQDYLAQLNQPKTDLQFMNSIIQGMPVSTSTLYNQDSSQVQNASSGLSPLGQFLQTIGSSGSAGKALGV
jgi:hypothetical protein